MHGPVINGHPRKDANRLPSLIINWSLNWKMSSSVMWIAMVGAVKYDVKTGKHGLFVTLGTATKLNASQEYFE